MNIKTILKTAAAQGYHFVAYYDDPSDYDYKGNDVRKCLEALEACDEMFCSIRGADGKRIASIHYIPGNDADERIADYGGAWMKQFEA